jgi:hypothetical protein
MRFIYFYNAKKFEPIPMKRIFTLLTLIAPLLVFTQEVSFTHATSLLPAGSKSDHAIGVSDMNGDGLDDIIRMNIIGETSGAVEQAVYKTIQGAPNETMTDEEMVVIQASGTSSADTWGLAVADVDRNGLNDLVAGGFYNGVYIIKADADGESYETDIELLSEIYVQGMSAFDIDNNGDIDFFICDDNDISQILTNDGVGNFSEVTSGLVPETDTPSDNSGNYGVCFMDVDNNGHADLYIAKCRQGVTSSSNPLRINLLYMNDGNGNWTSEGEARGLAIGAQSWSADFGDYDNDGDLDCFVTNHDAFCDLLENDGNGFFTEVTEEADLEGEFQLTPIQSTWVELNNDGFIDLLVTGQGSHYVALNDGDGTFTMYNDLFGSFPVNSYALGDLNNDGAMDVFHSAGGYGGWGSEAFEDRVYLNDGNPNNWIKVNLTGVESNINGIGARISIYGPWGVQIREIKAGESYGIQNTMTQHFGLGSNELIDQMTITWPSGTVDNYYEVTPNQQLGLVEGNGATSIAENENLAQVRLFPNPTDDLLEIVIGAYDEFATADLEFRIYNSLAKVIRIARITSPNLTLDVSELSTGLYTYSITADGKALSVDSFVKR